MRKTPVVMGVLAIIFGSIQVLMTASGWRARRSPSR
jgi:hypothetical protein